MRSFSICFTIALMSLAMTGCAETAPSPGPRVVSYPDGGTSSSDLGDWDNKADTNHPTAEVDACQPTVCAGMCGTGPDGCGGTLECEPCGAPADIVLGEFEITIVRGQAYLIDANLVDEEERIFVDPGFFWRSANEQVMTVNQEGSVFGRNEGLTHVVLTRDWLEAAVVVTVAPEPEVMETRAERGCAVNDPSC